MKEVWKKVDGFENYEVSNFGNLRRLYLNGYRLIKGTLDKDGYCIVRLSSKNKVDTFKLHRLVACYFVRPKYITYSPNLEINHIDGVKQNNMYTNLEWVTRSENVQHAYDTRLAIKPRGENHPQSCITQRIADDIRLEYSLLSTTYKELAEKYKVHSSTIGRVIRGEIY